MVTMGTVPLGGGGLGGGGRRFEVRSARVAVGAARHRRPGPPRPLSAGGAAAAAGPAPPRCPPFGKPASAPEHDHGGSPRRLSVPRPVACRARSGAGRG